MVAEKTTAHFPHDTDAQRLNQQAFLLSEFFTKFAPDFDFGKLDQKAIVQGHCHHKSIMSMGDEVQILKKLDVDFEMPEVGCCGMAGAFGFEQRDHYEVAEKLGNSHLIPAVKAAEPGTLLIADGFSCREQVAQAIGKHPLHLAQVLRMALRKSSKRRQEEHDGHPRSSPLPFGTKVAVASAAPALTGLAVFALKRRRAS